MMWWADFVFGKSPTTLQEPAGLRLFQICLPLAFINLNVAMNFIGHPHVGCDND